LKIECAVYEPAGRLQAVPDTYAVWRLANLEQQIDAHTSFLEACPWPDEQTRFSCRLAVEAARSGLVRGSIGELSDLLADLIYLAEAWRDRPGFPEARSASEADRLARDRVKDHLRAEFPAQFRDRIGALKLSIDVTYNRLSCDSRLDRPTRYDVMYMYGRATMALDLGHVQAAEQELTRLKAIEKEL